MGEVKAAHRLFAVEGHVGECIHIGVGEVIAKIQVPDRIVRGNAFPGRAFKQGGGSECDLLKAGRPAS